MVNINEVTSIMSYYKQTCYNLTKYSFLACECNPLGSVNSDVCEFTSGNCSCSANFGGRQCDRCRDGYYDFPQCKCKYILFFIKGLEVYCNPISIA